jgi:hypothetical protein
VEHVVRGDDVEEGDLEHLAGMVERHAMRHPAAAIVTRDEEAVEAEMPS